MPRNLSRFLWPLLTLAVANLSAIEPGHPEKIPLWAGEPPSGPGTPVSGTPSITVHLPQTPTGLAAVICPGGGYGGLVTGAEGHGIAQWLNQHGIAGIVLEYRLPKGNSFVPLADAQRALRLVRSHATEWKIDPKRVGIIGFSAGGHLASTASTHYSPGNPSASDPQERISCRPDFQILVYPVITMKEGTHGGSRRNLLGPNPSEEELQRFSNETQVNKETPPAYLAHAIDDRLVPL
jgi:acetyl esterase/lipase